MGAPVTECAKEFRLLWSEALDTCERYGRSTLQHGDERVGRKEVSDWAERLKGEPRRQIVLLRDISEHGPRRGGRISEQ
jgi:hypothetical protein